jgi:glycosyltransferase involved in cell wall biosynthesis
VKILWHSNAPWVASGYGKQTRLFAARLQKLGHEVAISAFSGLQGARIDFEGMTVYPRGIDSHGNDVLAVHAEHFFGGSARDGIVLPLTDIWVLRPEVLRQLRCAAWVPVDHDPCQPPSVRTLRKGNCLPIAMSRFGERMLLEAGFEETVYVPHGVELDVFRPHGQLAARKVLGLPQDAFLVGMVAANQGARKSFPQALRAFAIFRERHPDALLYLHTWLGPQFQGLDLNALAQQLVPREALLVCDQYRYAQGDYTDADLAQVYSALDLLMNPAQGEGFGVTIVEAQACGTPVLLTNFSSMPELCGAGWLVGGEPVYTSFQSWQLQPSVEAMVAALEEAYALADEERIALREQARRFSLAYSADLVTVDHFLPALELIEARLS